MSTKTNNRHNILLRKIRGSRGFTLPEMLLTVAIMAVLSAVVFIGASAMLKNSRQATSDKAAETIYTAVQAYLQEVYAFERGNEKYFTKDAEGNYILKNDGQVQGNIYYAKKTKGDDGSDAMKVIVNDGSVIGPDFYGKGLIIEYNPKSCQVFSVFYIDRDDIGNPPMDSPLRQSAEERKNQYKGYVGYYQGADQDLSAGFDDEMVVKLDNTAENKSGQLYNYDELTGEIYCKFPKEFLENKNNFVSDKKVRIEVEVENASDSQGKKKVTFSAEMDGQVAATNANKRNDKALKIPVYFDTLKDTAGNSRRFKDIFVDKSKDIWDTGSGLTVKSPKEEGSGAFVPGEDIHVTATVSIIQTSGSNSSDGLVLASASDDATDNSLFYYVEKDNKSKVTAGDVFLAYGRHLQNLDKGSGIEGTNSDITAKQIRDIDFSKVGTKVYETVDGEKTLKDDETGRLWNYVYKESGTGNTSGNDKLTENENYLSFTPITNSKLKKYVGNEEDPNKKDTSGNGQNSGFLRSFIVNAAGEQETHSIIGLHIDKAQDGNNTQENVGLFGTFSGGEISDLKIVSPKIAVDNATNAGGLAGQITGATKITNCWLYMRPKYEEDVKNGNTTHAKDSYLDMETGDGTFIKDANEYRDKWLCGGTNVGGLVGSASGDLTIEKSFAATIVNAKGDGSKAGGLVGDAGSAKVEIKQSYADCYIHGKTIGGLAAACKTDSTFTDCYSAGFVLGDTGNAGISEDVKAGAFVPDKAFQYAEGSGASSAKITNSYTLFNFSDITLATDNELPTGDPIPASLSSVKETETNGLLVPVTEEDLNRLSGKIKEPDNSGANGSGTHVPCELAKYFQEYKDKTGKHKDRLERFSRWDQALNSFTIDYPRAGLPHYGDWLPQENAEFKVDVVNTEILAFRIRTTGEPSSSTMKVRIKGVSSKAERTLNFKNDDTSGAQGNSANQLEEIRAYDGVDHHNGAEPLKIKFVQDNSVNATGTDKQYVSAWIVLDRLKNVAKDNTAASTGTDANWTFKGQFGSALSDANATQAEKIAFVPGEDIVISCGIEYPDAGTGSSNTTTDVDFTKMTDKDFLVNSLFSGVRTYSKKAQNSSEYEGKDIQARSGISSSVYDAKIAYGRHLQNLDTTVSGVDISNVTKSATGTDASASIIEAEQQNDIVFDEVDGNNEKSNQEAHEEDIKAFGEQAGASASGNESGIMDEYRVEWKRVYENRPFVPITNEKIDIYTGKKKGENTQKDKQTSIIGLPVTFSTNNNNDDNTKDAKDVLAKKNDKTNFGLFGTFNPSGSKKELSNIILAGPNIIGEKNGNAGGLAGEISGSGEVTIKACQLYMRNKKDITGDNDANYYKTLWLVGGSNAGGLVGLSGSSLKISDSFAATVVNAEGDNGNAGGLAGSTGNNTVTAERCYADCYIHGKNIGGLIGKCSKDSEFKSCYSAGFVLGGSNGIEDSVKAGAFVPDEDITAQKKDNNDTIRITHSYTLFNFSDITRASNEEGEAKFPKNPSMPYSVKNPINNGLYAPDKDEIKKLNKITDGIGKKDTSGKDGNGTHEAYYLAEYFRDNKGTGNDRLKRFARWLIKNNKGKFAQNYPRAGLPHYGDWLVSEPELSVVNGAMLYAHLRVPLSADVGSINLNVKIKNNGEHTVPLKVRGLKGNDEKVDPDNRHNIHRVEEDDGKYISYYIILDDITTKGMRFADIFDPAKFSDNDEKSEAEHFYPGVTIKEVTADLGVQKVTAVDGTYYKEPEEDTSTSEYWDDEDDDDDEDTSLKPTWNSIYANYSLGKAGNKEGNNDDNYYNRDNEKIALIRNFRHLENLDKNISLRKESGDDGANSNNTIELDEAKQIMDLTWRDDKCIDDSITSGYTKKDYLKHKETRVFINDIIILKKRWEDDLDNNGNNNNNNNNNSNEPDQLTWVSVYSGKANKSKIYSAPDDMEHKITNQDSEVHVNENKTHTVGSSYQPVNLFFSSNESFKYTGTRTTAAQGSVGGNGSNLSGFNNSNPVIYTSETDKERNSHVIKNLVVAAPDIMAGTVSLGAAAGKNTISYLEKNPDRYHIDAGLFGYVGIGESNAGIGDQTDQLNTGYLATGATFTVKDLILEGEDLENGAAVGGLIGRVNVLNVDNGVSDSMSANRSGFKVEIDNVNSRHHEETGKVIGKDTYIYAKMLYSDNDKLYSRGYSGGLVGVANDSTLKMTDCHVYGKYAFIRNDSNDIVMKSLEAGGAGSKSTLGGGASGGMIGNLQWCDLDIDKCSASIYVYGEQTDGSGGLLGRGYGITGTIKNSYTGGHTSEGAYQEGIYRRHSAQVASNVVGYNVTGGLVGYCRGMANGGTITIEDCFSAASVYSTWKEHKLGTEKTGGLCGGTDQIVRISHCYVVGRVYEESGFNFNQTGLFVGYMYSGDKSNYFENNYVLDGISYQVNYLIGGYPEILEKRVKLTKTDPAQNELRSSTPPEGWNNWKGSGHIETQKYDPFLSGEYPFLVPVGIEKYYGDWETENATAKQFDLKWKIDNKDKLTLSMEVPNTALKSGGCWLTMAIKGTESNKIHYAPIWVRSYGDGRTGKLSAKATFEDPKVMFNPVVTVLPDPIKDLNNVTIEVKPNYSTEDSSVLQSATLNFVLDDITSKEFHFAQIFPEFKYGENIEVYLAVGKKAFYDNSGNPVTDVTNAKLDDGKKNYDNTDNSEWRDVKKAISPQSGSVVKMITNSLFGNMTKSDELGNLDAFSADSISPATHSAIKTVAAETAEIRWSRHLQNLDPVVSGINAVGQTDKRNGLTFTSAVQTKDIDWNDFKETNGDNCHIYSFCQENADLKNKELTEEGEYYGIFNMKLQNYTGKVEENENKKATIKNIKIEGQAEKGINSFISASDQELGSTQTKYYDKGYSAGLFRFVIKDQSNATIETMAISNLSLSGFNVRAYNNDNRGAAGTVIGYVNNSIGGIILSDIEVDGTMVSATGDRNEAHAGGLIGNIGYDRDEKKGAGTEVIFGNNILKGNITIESTFKNAGGFIGTIKNPCGDVNINNCSIVMSDSSYIIGKNYAGGLIGFIQGENNDKDVSIKNIKVEKLKLKGKDDSPNNNQVGGLIGSVSGIKDFTITADDEKANSITFNNEIKAKSDVGGLVGYLSNSGNTLIDKTDLTGFNSSQARNAGTLVGLISNIPTSNTISCETINIHGTGMSNNSASAGGLIGKIENEFNSITINKIQMDGDIAVSSVSEAGGFIGTITQCQSVTVGGDENKKCELNANSFNISSTGGNTGGIIGYAKCKSISIKNTSLKDAIIKTENKDQMCSGGIVGKIAGDTGTEAVFESIILSGQNTKVISTVANNSNNHAGGIIGSVASAIKSLALKNIALRDKISIESQGHAGGLIGYIYAANSGSATVDSITIESCTPGKDNNTDLSVELTVKSNNSNAGGMIGNMGTSGKMTIKDCGVPEASSVTVTSGTGNTCNAGGIIGFVSNNQIVEILNHKQKGTLNVNAGNDAGGLIGKTGDNINIKVDNNTTLDLKEGSLVKNTETGGTDDNVYHAGGLFGCIGQAATININNVNISCLNVFGREAGGVIGRIKDNIADLDIKDVHVYGAKTYSYGYNSTGGFIGYLGKGGTIDIDSSSASVYVASKTLHAGGFIGRMRADKGTYNITNCYVGGHTASVGGKSGYNNIPALTEDSGSVNVTEGGYNVCAEKSDSSVLAGGFLGCKNEGATVTIDHCFSTASVYGKNAGGFYGGNAAVRGITNSYETGAVFGDGTSGADYNKFSDKTVGDGNYYLAESAKSNAGKADAITVEGLKALTGDNKPDKTIRYDIGELVNYPYPFYASAGTDKTFYGDWAESAIAYVDDYIAITGTVTYNNTVYNGTIYYYDGKFYATIEELNAARNPANNP